MSQARLRTLVRLPCVWLACAGSALAAGPDGSADDAEALRLRWSYGLAGIVTAPPASRWTARQWPDVPMERLSLDVSVDATARHGASQDASLTWAPAGSIHDSGWRVRLSYNRSRYSYPLEAGRVQGRSSQWDTMLGWGLHRPTWAATFLLGQGHSVADEEGQPRVRQRGMKATVSLFAAPTPGTRTFASLAYTEASDYTQAAWKWGWRWASGGAFAGPEIKADWRGRTAWREAPQVSRWGLHMSGLDWHGVSISASAGRMWGEADGLGRYLSLGLYGAF